MAPGANADNQPNAKVLYPSPIPESRVPSPDPRYSSVSASTPSSPVSSDRAAIAESRPS
jgi:hypothetical protein